MLFLRTLGGLSLLESSDPGAGELISNSKSLLILAVLATRPDHTARRDYIAELLWPGTDRSRGLRALRQALFYLSKHAADVVDKSDEALTLNRRELAVDLWDFDEAINQSEYERVLELYRGPFAAGSERKVGSEVEHWIESQNSRVLAGLEVAFPAAIARAHEVGDHREAVELAKRYAATFPLDDQAQQALIRTLADAGQDLEAVRAFEGYRVRMAEDDLEEEIPAELRERVDHLRAELRTKPTNGVPAGPRGANAASEPAGSTDGRPLPWWRSSSVRVASGVAALVLVVLAVRWPWPDPPTGPLAELDARILALREPGTTNHLVEIALSGASVSMTTKREVGGAVLPTPSGRGMALMQAAADGWNLALESDGQTRPLTIEPGDEYPLAWSPDARQLIYARRAPSSNGGSGTHMIMVRNVATDSVRPLTERASEALPSVSWSPSGTHIAFSAGPRSSQALYVVDADGANERELAPHPAWDGFPAWAPDGERLAFVSERDGERDVYSVRVDGSDVRRITQTAAAERDLMWLSPTILAYLARRDDQTDLWVVDTFTGQIRQLTRDGELTAIVGGPQTVQWIERVRVTPRPHVVSPGQNVFLSLQAHDPGGETVGVAGDLVRWTVVHDTAATMVDPGHLRINGLGQPQVIASAAGWRADTVALVSLSLALVTRDPTLVEPWTGGLNDSLWRSWGDPLPIVRERGAPDGAGVIIPNGDAFFASGAISEVAIPAADGVTIEFDARLRFTGMANQSLRIAVYGEAPQDSLLAAGAAAPAVAVVFRGPTPDADGAIAILTRDHRMEIPLPPDVRFWHEYALQLIPDQPLEIIRDGRMFWRSPAAVERWPNALHVEISGQMVGTELMLGRLRAYDRPKYRLPQLPPDPENESEGPSS